MGSPSSPSDPSAYFESLMRAGQQGTTQFDDALAAAMGVEGRPDESSKISPLAVAANLPQKYWSPVLDFWRGFFTGEPAANAGPPGRAPRGDRRFKDETWSQSPYHDLLKQS